MGGGGETGGRDQPGGIGLREDRLLQRARLGHRLEPELVVEQAPAGDVRVERVVLAAERVEREDPRAMGGLVEAVAGERGVGVRERGIGVGVRERRLGRRDHVVSTLPL